MTLDTALPRCCSLREWTQRRSQSRWVTLFRRS